MNDTLNSEHRRRKVRRILVRAATLAAGIKLIDFVVLGSECVVVISN